MNKVTVHPHPDYQKTLLKDPVSALAKCEVRARGKVFTVERSHQRGSAGTEAAATDIDIINKFRHNAERILTQQKIDKAVKLFMEVDKLENISQLLAEVIANCNINIIPE